MMDGGPSSPWKMARDLGRDSPVTRQRVSPGTFRKIVTCARPYRWRLGGLLLVTTLNAMIAVSYPLLFKVIIDDGILARDLRIIAAGAGAVAALAVLGALLGLVSRWFSAGVGLGLIYDLRTQLFNHVQRQPIAFFTRTQTGSLVSRVNGDVVGAQRALTTVLSRTLSSLVQLIFVLATMFYLSWLVTLIALAMVPLFILPAKLLGRRLQRLTRESMQVDAEMGAMMTERFNTSGATLAKLYGRPAEDSDLFGSKATHVRDVGVTTIMHSGAVFVSLTLISSIAAAVIYGVGGWLVVGGVFQIGTLVALATLLTRLYTPISSLSNAQVTVMTALVSFDRVFEVLALEPLVKEKPGATPLVTAAPAAENGSAPAVEFDHVSFRYPAASEVSLATLESTTLPSTERATRSPEVLHDVSFRAPPGKLTALVGPTGAGKTTITHLVPRLYDPEYGAVRVGDRDVRDLTLESLHAAVGVVPQEAHLFHDTIRANLAYARPGASERDLVAACRGAQIWDLISSLPNGLDTVAGDRGHQLSGGQKQQIALARLLLKAPPAVILDEATAHMDSESEAAVQRALAIALGGRTSLVIAHRLSTIRRADQILVIDSGRVRERGTHSELLAVGDLYAKLYHTQFSHQENVPGSGEHRKRNSDSTVRDHLGR